MIGVASCEKDPDEAPGKIPGMGTTPGDIEVSENFKLPTGISLMGALAESNTQDPDYSIFGSGDHIKLKMILLNATDVARTVYFPRGLIIKNSMPQNHNAIVLQTTWVVVKPNTQREITLELYCVNEALFHATESEPYNFHGVAVSSTINELLDIIDGRKINYEMIYGTFDGKKSEIKSGPSYEEITERLQQIVWNLTDFGVGISAEDKAFIESIPTLSSSEIPPEPYPVYFPEFVVPGK